MKTNCIVGTYKGRVQFSMGYRDSGKFYDLDGNETTLSNVSKCVDFELVIQKQDCNLIWGVYKFYNPIEKKQEVDNFSGSRLLNNNWRIRDGDEVGSLNFENKCNLTFALEAGNQVEYDKKPGFFELINGQLKKKNY